MSPCKVCGLTAREGRDTCSTECAVEAWAATWAVTRDDRDFASWCWRRRWHEVRGIGFIEKSPPDASERAWRSLLRSFPNLKARWEAA